MAGCVLEIPAKVTLRFNLIKEKPIKWPRIEISGELMMVGSSRPMEDAVRIAYAELINWLVELDWDQLEADQVFAQVGTLSVGNMVNSDCSLVAKVKKQHALK